MALKASLIASDKLCVDFLKDNRICILFILGCSMNRVVTNARYPIKIWASILEEEAEEQIKKTASMPFIHRHVAVMSDAHAGRGSTIGTVIATKGAIVPAAVGVDIGCGMMAVKLPLKINDIKNLNNLRHSWERTVPVGRNENRDVKEDASVFLNSMGKPSGASDRVYNKSALQLGTLGGGNHFIELCYDREGDAWIMLHSGSRNIGKELADVHINGAKDLMKKYFIDLPDPDLSYLAEGTDEFNAYIEDMHWAQNFAMANRNLMMDRLLYQFAYHQKGSPDGWEGYKTFCVNCHHNFCQKENHFGSNVWVTRKGAVSARENQFGIIPGSMGERSFIVKGKGNEDSFTSCSHGAGRMMSRTKARSLFTVEDLVKATEGVECRKDSDVIDEIPNAYKPIDVVMKDQEDLVEIVHELKQVLCIKGG